MVTRPVSTVGVFLPTQGGREVAATQRHSTDLALCLG